MASLEDEVQREEIVEEHDENMRKSIMINKKLAEVVRLTVMVDPRYLYINRK